MVIESKTEISSLIRLSRTEHPQIIAFLANLMDQKDLIDLLEKLPADLSSNLFRRIYHQPFVDLDKLSDIFSEQFNNLLCGLEAPRAKLKLEIEDIFFRLPKELQRKIISNLIGYDPHIAKFLLEKCQDKFEFDFRDFINETQENIKNINPYKEMTDNDIKTQYLKISDKEESADDELDHPTEPDTLTAIENLKKDNPDIMSMNEINALLASVNEDIIDQDQEKPEEEIIISDDYNSLQNKENLTIEFLDETMNVYSEVSLEIFGKMLKNIKELLSCPLYRYNFISTDNYKISEILLSIEIPSPLWLFKKIDGTPQLIIEIGNSFAYELIATLFGVSNLGVDSAKHKMLFGEIGTSILTTLFEKTIDVDENFDNMDFTITYYDNVEILENDISLERYTPVLNSVIETKIGTQSNWTNFIYFPTLYEDQ